MFARLFRTATQISPRLRRAIWKFSYDYLARTYRQDFWKFMNYGYAPSDPKATGIVLADSDEADRYCIQLYHLVAGSINMAGLDVLEVGCGRGGGASYIARYLKPKTMVGLDFSRQAIDFCRQHHSANGLSFVEGDAENLPFNADRFDAVVNVESSHCYASMDRFLSEVRRVLKPGGFLLFADLRGKEQADRLRQAMKGSGMAQVEESNITDNVIRALDLDNNRKSELIQQTVRGPLLDYFKDFAGIKESGVYQRFWNGQNIYLKFVLKKT